MITVISAHLHQAILIPGANMTERTLNNTKLPGAVFTFIPDENCLQIELKGITALIPIANVDSMVIERKIKK